MMTQAHSTALGRIRAIPGRFTRRGARESYHARASMTAHVRRARHGIVGVASRRAPRCVARPVAGASRLQSPAVIFACPTAARRCETSRGDGVASSLPRARAPRASPASIARPAPRSAPRLRPATARRGGAVRARAFGEGIATVTWPLVQPTDPWGVWAAILCASSFGLWGNKQRWGARVGGARASLSTLLALFLSNVGACADGGAPRTRTEHRSCPSRFRARCSPPTSRASSRARGECCGVSSSEAWAPSWAPSWYVRREARTNLRLADVMAEITQVLRELILSTHRVPPSRP